MESIFFIHSLGIDPSHRKRGIAQTLVKLSLEVTDPFSDVIVDILEANVSYLISSTFRIGFFQLANNLSYDCATSMATSPYSRKIFENMEFQTLRTIDWRNFVTDYRNGRTPIFPNVDSSAHIKFLMKSINDQNRV